MVAAIGCSGAPPAPVTPVVHAAPPVDAAAALTEALDQDLPKLVARSLVMQQDVAAALTASDDCAAVTAKLGQLAARYHDVAIANAKVVHDGRGDELHAVLDPQAPAFDSSARAIMQSPTLARCAPDPAFAHAFDQLFTPPA